MGDNGQRFRGSGQERDEENIPAQVSTTYILYIKTRLYLLWNIQVILYILFKILDLKRFQYSSTVPM